MKTKIIKCIIAMCMMLSVVLLAVPSKAYAASVTVGDTVYSNPDYTYAYYWIDKDGSAILVYSDSLVGVNSDGVLSVGYDLKGFKKTKMYRNGNEYMSTNGSAEAYSWNLYSTHDSVSTMYTNVDILDTSGNVVFQKVSLPLIPQVTVGTVAPIRTTLLGLIKLLVPLMVGWLALRKALAMLSRILRQA